MFGFNINNYLNVVLLLFCVDNSQQLNYVYSKKTFNLSSCYGNYILMFTRLTYARKEMA